MVPAAHLLGCEGGDEPTSLVEELVALTASVAKLRWPALARCKSGASHWCRRDERLSPDDEVR